MVWYIFWWYFISFYIFLNKAEKTTLSVLAELTCYLKLLILATSSLYFWRICYISYYYFYTLFLSLSTFCFNICFYIFYACLLFDFNIVFNFSRVFFILSEVRFSFVMISAVASMCLVIAEDRWIILLDLATFVAIFIAKRERRSVCFEVRLKVLRNFWSESWVSLYFLNIWELV